MKFHLIIIIISLTISSIIPINMWGQRVETHTIDTGKVEIQRPMVKPSSSQEDISYKYELQKRRSHPLQKLFPKRPDRFTKLRSDNHNKLLVLLVDFQEYDDPKTTGNGKFELDPNPYYPISIGAPPRDYDFFSLHLEALKYYYLAASLGSYDLEFDIFPKKEDPKFAYTLPQKMRYYNPGMHDQQLFVTRVEEYFQDIFKVADSYNEIDFSQYGHFMFIHAGSDWQHDIYGDTPHDLPSFFITVGEGKEAIVNDGTVKISSAANVPETISQDGRYGAINAVMAHEFGHSLGFVDLYNVNNSYPGVGYWDIMDSGGVTQVLLEGNDGDIYPVEGVLPALPSAWHRLLAWEDYYKEEGFYKKITDFEQRKAIDISAASLKPNTENDNPYILKVPINNYEYLLLENRHVDPEGKGGIAIRGAHPQTEGGTDYRVVLHPIAIDDDAMQPTYEYDWLLPGWMNRHGESFGGGIIAWHIDNNIIYNEGVILSDGSFRSNYANNSVNTDFYNRGIRIIEADDIKDIGNPYSWYWQGTEYEPFFRYKPQLDSDGFFIRWSHNDFNRTLSSVSKPPLTSNDGYHSLYTIYDISSSSGIMSLKYKFEPFMHTDLINSNEQTKAIGTPGQSAHYQFSTVLPVFTSEGVNLHKWLHEDNSWVQFTTELEYTLSHPVLTSENLMGNTTFYIPSKDRLIVIEELGIDNEVYEIELGSELTESPIIVEFENDLFIISPTMDEIIVIDEETRDVVNRIEVTNTQLSFDGEILYAISSGEIYVFDLEDLVYGSQLNSFTKSTRNNHNLRNYSPNTKKDQYFKNDNSQISPTIPHYDSSYSPASYRDLENSDYNSLFVQNKFGDIYLLRDKEFHRLFSLSPYTNQKPTQISFVKGINNNSLQESIIYLFFAAGQYLFLIDINGTLADGYPRKIENKSFLPFSYPRSFTNKDDENLIMLEIEDQGYLAYNKTVGIIEPELSIIWNKPQANDILFWDKKERNFTFFFSDRYDNLYGNILFTDITENPITWNGFRNLGWSTFQGVYQPGTKTEIVRLDAYAFPNPVSTDEVRVRVKNYYVEGDNSQFDHIRNTNNPEKGVIEIKLFDVSGRVVYQEIMTSIVEPERDILIDTTNLSSGIYFGVVSNNGKEAKFRLAVEK